MSSRHKALVVCGYGCHLVPELTHYLDRVVAYANERQPGVIVLCGGPTQQASAPGTTEAALMAIYIRERLNYMPGWLLEESSFTTHGNMRGAARLLEEFFGSGWHSNAPPACDVTVFCEATRSLKVAAMVRRFFGFPPARGQQPVRIETDSWELMHPLKELIGTLKDFACLYVPGFADWHAWQRRRRAKRI